MAPGEQLLTTTLGNEFGVRSGSSMAASVVTGVAGLLLSANPGLSAGQLRSLLMDSANEKRLDAFRAVSRNKNGVSAGRSLAPKADHD